MRWYFRDEDLAKDEPQGLCRLFELMQPALEYDEMRCIWIMKRK